MGNDLRGPGLVPGEQSQPCRTALLTLSLTHVHVFPPLLAAWLVQLSSQVDLR